jgi:Na+/proline symporter
MREESAKDEGFHKITHPVLFKKPPRSGMVAGSSGLIWTSYKIRRMSPAILIALVIVYFLALLWISWYTGRGASNQSYFVGNKSSPWYIVAFGMIGTSLSGVTFVSVPGTVAASGMSYLMVVFGYFIGYLGVAYILLPIYYRMQLTSIYHYLQERFGMTSYKTGAGLFIVSRTIGATARLYLVIRVLQELVLDSLGIPFILTALCILLLILAYTYKGGVKTIVWTDTLQTTFMLGGLIACTWYALDALNLGFAEAWTRMQTLGYTHMVETDWLKGNFVLKHLLGGAFIALTMTGLDQEMMQKNISVRTLADSQKNVVTLSVILIAVNFLFLFLGGVLYLYSDASGLALKGDDLFPTLALEHFPPVMGLVFIIALVSALFPSADGAITALTASTCIDLIGMRRKNYSDEVQTRIRRRVHLSFAGVFLICVLIFHWIDSRSVIDLILKLAGYTYGPLLGLFAFGVVMKHKLKEAAVPFVCLIAPALTWLLADKAPVLLGGYTFGIELLLVNGLITFAGLYLVRKESNA